MTTIAKTQPARPAPNKPAATNDTSSPAKTQSSCTDSYTSTSRGSSSARAPADPAVKPRSMALSRAPKKGLSDRSKRAKRRMRTAEQNLRRLGYDPGRADGVVTSKTAGAVKAFRRDQQALENGRERLSDKAHKLLAKEAAALQHAPRRRRVKNTKAQRRDNARVMRGAKRVHNDGSVGLSEGASNRRAVRTVQEHLRAAGYNPKRDDGVFDDRTAGALKAFQRHARLPATGVVDVDTWRQLRRSEMEADGPTSPSQRMGEMSAAVRATEKQLKKLGLNPGKVDGLYTKQTQNAVDRFRKKERLGGLGHGVTKRVKRRMGKALRRRKVSASQLKDIMPGLSSSRARKLVDPLNRAMREFGIKSKKRKAAFLAQVGHESVGLRYFEEIASGQAYEGRLDLGNTQPGDGVRFKGRGPIQLTGRANYRRAGQALGLPLEQNPKLASDPRVGFRIAGWFWKSHGLNELADRSEFTRISEVINGGHNGLADRFAYWARAKRALA